jgi:multidrug resistance efflux pump
MMTITFFDAQRWPMRVARVLLTLCAVAAAAWCVLRLWDHYELAPWTRDGRVRANIVQIAPDVSGLVTAVPIQDNQQVHAGQLLFEVDSARYTLAVRQAEAALGTQRTALTQALRESERNKGLGTLVSQEQQEQARTRVEQARSALQMAAVALESAKLNLERARVRAPSDGTVTNLDLREGSYASAGRAVLAVVDTQSFYVEGYFEETKLARIHLGDRVQVLPMGRNEKLGGTVQSVVAGIADHDRSTSSNLLPSVNPTFNWVRLPQRIPVRIQLDPLPAEVRLVAGQTVTVEIQEAKAGRPAITPSTTPASAPASAAASKP